MKKIKIAVILAVGLAICACVGKNPQEYFANVKKFIEGKTLPMLVTDDIVRTTMTEILNDKIFGNEPCPSMTYSVLYDLRHGVIDALVCPAFGGKVINYGRGAKVPVCYEAMYASFSYDPAAFLKKTSLKPEDVKDIPKIYNMVIDMGKKTLSDPDVALALVQSKEKVVREVLKKYSKKPADKKKFLLISEWLDNAKQAVKAAQEPGFRSLREQYIKAGDALDKARDRSKEEEEYELYTKYATLEEQLKSLTPDYHVSMFVLRRVNEGGEKVFDGALKAIDYAHLILNDYL